MTIGTSITRRQIRARTVAIALHVDQGATVDDLVERFPRWPRQLVWIALCDLCASGEARLRPDRRYVRLPVDAEAA